MKRHLIILIFILTPALAGAQNLLFSFKANPQITWFSGSEDSYEANGSFGGFNLGIEGDFFFTEKYAFTAGFMVNRLKGGVIYDDVIRFESTDTTKWLDPGSRITHTLQYINVPLGVKFKTIEIGYSTFWFNTGISPAFMIKSRAADESDTYNNTDLIDDFKFFNLSYFIKAGVEYSLGGSTALIGGIGYNSGLTDITKSSRETLNTRSFSIILGVSF